MFAIGALVLAAVVQVTHFGGANGNARWSPDGKWIAFDSQRRADVAPGHASRTIRVVDADGRNERVLTNSRRDQAPAISPDGEWIAFESYRDGGSQIYLMRKDGSEQRRLTDTPGYHSGANFSPDGASIVWFTGPTYDAADVWVMARDGSAKKRLTTNPAADTYPAFSPDGKRIIFTSHRHGNTELYLMNADGSGERRLTSHPASDDHARWAPDSRRVIFESWRRGSNGIFVLDTETGAVEQLALPHVHAHLPDWSADGKWILYHAPGAEGSELYRVEAPRALPQRMPSRLAALHREATPLAATGAQESFATWSPDGRLIAYMTDAGPDDWGDESIQLLDLESGVSGRMRRSVADRHPDWSAANGLLLFVTQTRDEASQICWARTDGRDTRCFAATESLRGKPRWSADGKEVIWIEARGEKVDVFAGAIADKSVRQLTRDGGTKVNASLSPNGERVVYTIVREGKRLVMTTILASGETRELTAGDLAVFSPDGSQLAFVSDREGNSDVYVMSADGSDVRNVSNHAAFDSQPAWRPDGLAIAFTSKRNGNADIFAVLVERDPRQQRPT